MSFIAQINLAEAKRYDSENLLPDHGLLFFFHEMDTMRWGFDPKDKGCAKIVYSDAPLDDLVETDLPDDLEDRFCVPEREISFSTEQNMPNFDEYCELINKELEWRKYCNKYETEVENLGIELVEEPDRCFKLLGYADLLLLFRSKLNPCFLFITSFAKVSTLL